MHAALERCSGLGAVLRRALDEGLTTSLSVYASLGGRPVVDAAVCRDDAAPVDAETAFAWLCGGKPLVAVTCVEALTDAQLPLATPVAELVPALGTLGPHVTIERVLTQCIAFPTAVDDDPRCWSGTPWVLDRLVALGPVDDVVRLTHTKHVGWAVLAACVEKVTGSPLTDLLDRTLVRPLGLGTVNVGGRQAASHATHLVVGDDGRAPLTLVERARTGPLLPGVGLWGSARDLGSFYEMFLAERPPVRPATLEAVRLRRRTGLRLGPHADGGLGVELESRHLSPRCTTFGTRTSLDAFGRDGGTTCFAFCDPGPGLVFVLLTDTSNPKAQLQHRLTWLEASRRLCADLGLAP